MYTKTTECSSEKLPIPHTDIYLYPGCKVKLGRFEEQVWIVNFGWFSYSGNRPFCGWFLVAEDGSETKPLQLPDLDDIYMIEHQ